MAPRVRYRARMRVYGSKTAQERQQERREKLIDAGLTVFGSVGVAGTSVRMVLREAGLQDRYFSESFAGIPELLIAVHDQVHDLLLAKMQIALADATDPVQACRIMLTEIVRFAEVNEAAMRIKIVETLGVTPAVDARRIDALGDYAVMIERVLPAPTPGGVNVDRVALCRAIISGVNGMLLDWITGQAAGDGQQVVENGVLLFSGILRVLSDSDRATPSPSR